METRPINMRLPPSVLKKLDEIGEKRSLNRTQAVSLCVKITHTILQELDREDTLSLKKQDGSEKKILFIL